MLNEPRVLRLQGVFGRRSWLRVRSIDYQSCVRLGPDARHDHGSGDLTIMDMNAAYLDVVGRDRDNAQGSQRLRGLSPDRVKRWAMLPDIAAARGAHGRGRRPSPGVLPHRRQPAGRRSRGPFLERVPHCPIRDQHGEPSPPSCRTRRTSRRCIGRRLAPDRRKRTGILGKTGAGARGAHPGAQRVACSPRATQLRNLFMSAPSFMCVLRGADYRFELANLAFSTLVGERDLLGHARSIRAIPEAAGQLYVELLDKVFQSGEAFVGKQMRVEFERHPGQPPDEVFINFVFQPILGDDGTGGRDLHRRQRCHRPRPRRALAGPAGPRTPPSRPQHPGDGAGRDELDGADRRNDR